MFRILLDNWDYTILILGIIATAIIIINVALIAGAKNRNPIILGVILTCVAPVFMIITIPVAAYKIPRTRLPILVFLMLICVSFSLMSYKSIPKEVGTIELLNGGMQGLREGSLIILNKHVRTFSNSIPVLAGGKLYSGTNYYYEILPFTDQIESGLRVFSYYYGFNKTEFHDQDKVFDKFYGFAILASNVKTNVLDAIKDHNPEIDISDMLVLVELGEKKVEASKSFNTISFIIFLAFSVFFAFFSLMNLSKYK